MSVSAVIAAGLRVALQRWPAVLLLFVVNLAYGLIFTAASWSWLSLALGTSLATRTLHADLDANVFVDLFLHHGESLQLLLVSGGILAAMFALLGVWLNATAVAAVVEDGTLGRWMSRGAQLYGRFLRLWMLTGMLCVASAGATFFLARWLVRLSADSPVESTFYWVSAGGAALGAGLLLFWSTVHDHARIRVAATGAGAAPAYAWAVRFAVARERRAVPLAALWLAGGGVLWAIYQTVGMLIATTSGPELAVSLIWGEMLLVARMLLRVGLFAAENDLQAFASDDGR